MSYGIEVTELVQGYNKPNKANNNKTNKQKTGERKAAISYESNKLLGENNLISR